LEQLKQEVITRIRENNQAEQMLNDLDIKIALLVRNRTTIDEVLKSNSAKKAYQQQATAAASTAGTSVSGNLNYGEIFSSANLKSLDKDSRRRLELYQNLFYVLQTQPKYLAKVVHDIKQTKIRNFLDHVLLALFNFASSAREEYLLVKFFDAAIRTEMQGITEVADFMRGNPVLIKMVVHYTRYD
jgi:Ras GTPase-activating-like protein IQGAP2/3